MKQGIEFHFRNGDRKFLVFTGQTQAAIIRAAEKYQRRVGAVGFVLREQLLDPRRRRGPMRRVQRSLKIGVGKIAGAAHGYLGRHVLDLGDRHAHAIVDIPWDSLKVKLAGLKAKFDPWRRALRGSRARLLAIRNPSPTDAGDRAIVEAALHVNRGAYKALRKSGEFDILPDGVLARRGRNKKATNIFVMPP